MLAGLRLGLYELLFSDGTPDHAAVDQAVELVKRAGAAHAAGLVNAVLRRAAREREALVAALLDDDSTPELAAVAHSAPLWLARMWWEELGAESARSLLAACNEPAEIAFRVNRRDRARARGDARRRCRNPESRPGSPDAPWPLAPPETIVIEGRTGDDVPARVGAGELTPQSRGSAAVVEVLDPQPGRARARPLRRARDEDRARSRRGWRTAARSSRSSSTPSGPPKWPARRSGWDCAASP